MRILLIHPKREDAIFEDVRLPPLGVAYVAATLRAAHHEVQILDANLENEQFPAIRSKLGAFSPDIVGVSVVSQLLKTALKIAAFIKNIEAGTAVVFGGVHPTLFPEAVAADKNVDYVVHGEGEDTVVELGDRIEKKQEPEGVLGTAYKKNGRIIVNPPRPLVRPLDRLPFPAYDLLPVDRYVAPQTSRTPFMAMITSRGCPYRCIFCDSHIVMGREYRFHSPERTQAEIRHLIDKFSVKEVMFKDSEFLQNRPRIEGLCDLLIKEKMPLRWSCNGRAGKADPLLLNKLKQAGCVLIMYGVESGDQAILNRLKKGITINQVRETFTISRQAGLKTQANFLIGSPGETSATISKTIRLAKEIKPDFVYFDYLFPYPGTELYRMALENNWLPEGFEPSDMKEFQCPLNATLMSTAHLRRMLDLAYRSFYFRPRIIIGRMLTLSPLLWKNSLRAFVRILKLRHRR